MQVPSTIGELTKSARELSKNPLGVIALFIVLVYGIAALVLGLSSRNLQICERLPIVWFIVLFPFAVLAAFYQLVAHHHAKLYSPRDFPDPEGFFRALSPTEQKEQLEDEIRATESELPEPEGENLMAVERGGTETTRTAVGPAAMLLAEEQNSSD